MIVNAIFMVLIETLKSMFFKIAYKAVLERFMTRLIIAGGDKLVSMSTNTLDDRTWQDIKDSLKGKGLKIADELKNDI